MPHVQEPTGAAVRGAGNGRRGLLMRVGMDERRIEGLWSARFLPMSVRARGLVTLSSGLTSGTNRSPCYLIGLGLGFIYVFGFYMTPQMRSDSLEAMGLSSSCLERQDSPRSVTAAGEGRCSGGGGSAVLLPEYLLCTGCGPGPQSLTGAPHSM